MANEQMAEFWSTRGGDQWVSHQERYDAMLAPCESRLMSVAACSEGEKVLDIGCGNGATTLDVALRVAPSGHVTGIDVSEPMLDVARRRAEAASAPATFIHADAQTADLGGPYDVAISRFGVMFFDEPVAAFANIARALRPGGRLAFVCWQSLSENEWLSVPTSVLVPIVGSPEPVAAGAPGPGAFADSARTTSILHDAGFVDITMTATSDPLTLGRDSHDVANFFATDTLGLRLFAGREPAVITEAMAALEGALRSYQTPEGVRLSSQYWLVSARRP
jgi:SAM-dependent methyltransferase